MCISHGAMWLSSTPFFHQAMVAFIKLALLNSLDIWSRPTHQMAAYVMLLLTLLFQLCLGQCHSVSTTSSGFLCGEAVSDSFLKDLSLIIEILKGLQVLTLTYLSFQCCHLNLFCAYARGIIGQCIGLHIDL